MSSRLADDAFATPGAERRRRMLSLGAVSLSGGRYEIHRPDGLPVPFEAYDAVPDDRWIWELVEGRVLVSPPPSARVRLAARQLHWELAVTAPSSACVVTQPARVRIDAGASVLAPDVVVIGCEQLGRRYVRPLLVADIRSPPEPAGQLGSTLTPAARLAAVRRRLFAQAGVPSYWVASTTAEPSITALALAPDGAYVEAAVATGSEALEVALPFPVRVVPASLAVG